MMHSNLIDGEWIDGNDMVRNINPSDTNDVIGEYARASGLQVMSLTSYRAAPPRAKRKSLWDLSR
ncbi:hypothetical protein LPJGGPFB_06564 [Ensifer adhaerens]|uniref:hypothetical protein n=1 Tax=Ensifer adhaerens TaxID=106592 RepID=UPI00156872F7|nr:hypothetical protein [Ensifer adhaerens]NRP23294.1 hypothetical protein [Ensifer adhaerens]